MNNYTKPNKYYEDEYDRETIEKMKELEKQNKAHLKKVEEALKLSYSLSRATAAPEMAQ